MSVLTKVKNKLANSKVVKWLATSMVAASIAVMGCISAFAADDTNVTTQLQTAFTSVKTDIFSYITTILPIALAVVGLIFGIKQAIKFFKNVAK